MPKIFICFYMPSETFFTDEIHIMVGFYGKDREQIKIYIDLNL